MTKITLHTGTKVAEWRPGMPWPSSGSANRSGLTADQLAAKRKFAAEQKPKTSTGKRALKVAARGNPDDRRQIIADLISDDRSRFRPEDLDSLQMMSDATLRLLRDDALGKPEETDDGEPASPVRPVDDEAVRAMTVHVIEQPGRPVYNHRRHAEQVAQFMPGLARTVSAAEARSAADDPAVRAMTAPQQIDWKDVAKRQSQQSRRGSDDGSPDRDPD